MLRIALIIIIFIGANPALAERRVAMVIGNSDYQHATRLPIRKTTPKRSAPN